MGYFGLSVLQREECQKCEGFLLQGAGLVKFWYQCEVPQEKSLISQMQLDMLSWFTGCLIPLNLQRCYGSRLHKRIHLIKLGWCWWILGSDWWWMMIFMVNNLLRVQAEISRTIHCLLDGTYLKQSRLSRHSRWSLHGEDVTDRSSFLLLLVWVLIHLSAPSLMFLRLQKQTDKDSRGRESAQPSG